MHDYAHALAFARALAADTGTFLKSAAGGGLADLKHDGSFVTEFDLASDRRITDAITARYPGHVVMSEERRRDYAGEEWCWMIDPIDGTTNFTWGFPIWGVLIALLHRGEPVAGAAHFPMMDELYSGALGLGAWLNGARITSLDAQRVGRSHLFGVCSRTEQRGPLPFPAKARIAGSSGYDLALLAGGRYAGMLNQTAHVWDVAALWPVVHEAGGSVKASNPSALFPLRQGTDYTHVQFSILGACSESALLDAEPKLRQAGMWPPASVG